MFTVVIALVSHMKASNTAGIDQLRELEPVDLHLRCDLDLTLTDHQPADDRAQPRRSLRPGHMRITCGLNRLRRAIPTERAADLSPRSSISRGKSKAHDLLDISDQP